MADPGRKRPLLSITTALTLGLCLLVSLVVALVLLTSYPVAQRNTIELLQDKSQLVIDSLLARTREHLNPARAEVSFLADLMSAGRLNPDNPEALHLALQSSLAAVPQVSAIGFVDRNLIVTRAFRNRPENPISVSDWSEDLETRRVMDELRAKAEPSWGTLFFAEESAETFVNVRAPVRVEGEFLGLLVAGVSVRALSEFLSDIATSSGLRPFILYGERQVIAHPLMIEKPWSVGKLTDFRPLPDLEDFPDPVLKQIWNDDRDSKLEESISNGLGVRAVRREDSATVYLFNHLFDYADQPLVVGAYFESEEIGAQVARLVRIPWAAFAVFLAAVAMAVAAGWIIGRPVRDLARAAAHIRELDIDGAPSLRSSPLKELNEAAEAFNAMVRGLKSFEAYVPRNLVLRLIGERMDRDIDPETREITVLFTDIVGFTAMAERMPAQELAELLNAHFALVNREIEAEGGTLDKYIGDSVMAFWGAPERQSDHPERACRAAMRIAEALRHANLARRLDGLEPILLRIGIHTGSALLGNIGAPGRLNYTVIGDMVNVADRLEKLSRDIVPNDEEVGVLISDDTAARLSGRLEVAKVGRYDLKGRKQGLQVYRLSLEPAQQKGADLQDTTGDAEADPVAPSRRLG